MGSALGTKPPSGMIDDKRSSAPQNTAVGSGSRPGTSKMPIKVSSPSNNHTQDRDPPKGWLK